MKSSFICIVLALGSSGFAGAGEAQKPLKTFFLTGSFPTQVQFVSSGQNVGWQQTPTSTGFSLKAPGPLTFGAVAFRGTWDSTPMASLFEQALEGSVTRSSFGFSFQAPSGNEVARYNLFECWPSMVTLSGLNVDSSLSPMIQTVLMHDAPELAVQVDGGPWRLDPVDATWGKVKTSFTVTADGVDIGAIRVGPVTFNVGQGPICYDSDCDDSDPTRHHPTRIIVAPTSQAEVIVKGWDAKQKHVVISMANGKGNQATLDLGECLLFSVQKLGVNADSPLQLTVISSGAGRYTLKSGIPLD